MNYSGCFTFLVIVLVKCVNSGNILAILAVASPSHRLWNTVLVNKLADMGHHVYAISDLVEDKSRNITYFHLENIFKYLYEEGDNDKNINSDIEKFLGADQWTQIQLTYNYFDKVCKGGFESQGFHELLKYPNDFKFDLVLFDYTMGPCFLAFLHKFNYPPMVGITAFNIPPLTVDLVGGHLYPAYIPFYSTYYDTNMNFGERFFNTLIYYGDSLYKNYIHVPKMNEWIKPYFGDGLPSLNELEAKAQLVLVNSNPAVNFAEPLPPNVISVGGLQIEEPKPLPKEMEDFINKSKKGAVLFSLGTNVKSVYLGKRRCNIIVKALAQLPDYHFLWKLESKEFIEEIPKNVFISSWLPQNDILGHPKTKGFISHAGGLSTHEASWYGVPMIGMPIFVDQHRNIHKSVLAGVAEKLDILSMTTEDIRHQVKKVLETPSYRENMKMRSTLFRDTPMKPLQTAVWWIEYVLRHPKATHLRSPTLDIGWWKANSIDIILVMFLSGLAILLLFANSVIKIFKFFESDKKIDKKNVGKLKRK